MQGLLVSVEGLLGALSKALHSIELTGRVLRPIAKPPKPAKTSFLVWRARCMGCCISGGSIHLLPGCILLLTGHGAHFTNTSFTGVSTDLVSRISMIGCIDLDFRFVNSGSLSCAVSMGDISPAELLRVCIDILHPVSCTPGSAFLAASMLNFVHPSRFSSPFFPFICLALWSPHWRSLMQFPHSQQNAAFHLF